MKLVNEPSLCVDSSDTGQCHAHLNHPRCCSEECIAWVRFEVVSEPASVLHPGLVNKTTKDLRQVECPDETNEWNACR